MPFVSSPIFCFSEKKFFFSFDGENYHSVELTKYSHRYTYALGNYKGNALTVGCDRNYADCSFATELLNVNNLKWSSGPDFPFGSRLAKISPFRRLRIPY